MSAIEWDEGMVLTWSGRWHHTRFSGEERQSLTLCGAYGYHFGSVPRYVRRLMDITTGVKAAPVCKKCERAAGEAQKGDG